MENSPNGGQKVSMDIKAEASEFEGNNLDEAINKAVLKLGVPKDKLDIKIVCEEKRGLFGMQGAKSAKIKVTIK
jgi:spoIIIJ-associated protein